MRKAFDEPKDGDSDIRGFTPQLSIPLPMRVSQIAFSADETYLIVSAESGGGLAVYDVQSLLQGNTQTAFELATNGEALRTLLPNPTAEKAELCAVVTSNGNLLMANLKERAVNALKDQVSSISWSTKGKQLVAGLADGTIQQLTPEGETKAEIPKPPNVGDYHGTSMPPGKYMGLMSRLTRTLQCRPSPGSRTTYSSPFTPPQTNLLRPPFTTSSPDSPLPPSPSTNSRIRSTPSVRMTSLTTLSLD